MHQAFLWSQADLSVKFIQTPFLLCTCLSQYSQFSIMECLNPVTLLKCNTDSGYNIALGIPVNNTLWANIVVGSNQTEFPDETLPDSWKTLLKSTRQHANM